MQSLTAVVGFMTLEFVRVPSLSAGKPVATGEYVAVSAGGGAIEVVTDAVALGRAVAVVTFAWIASVAVVACPAAAVLLVESLN